MVVLSRSIWWEGFKAVRSGGNSFFLVSLEDPTAQIRFLSGMKCRSGWEKWRIMIWGKTCIDFWIAMSWFESGEREDCKKRWNSVFGLISSAFVMECSRKRIKCWDSGSWRFKLVHILPFLTLSAETQFTNFILSETHFSDSPLAAYSNPDRLYCANGWSIGHGIG